MDSLDIFEGILDNLIDQLEPTNPGVAVNTTEGSEYWFNDGIKRITGENIYFTTYGEAVEGRRPVVRLGTVIEVPVARFKNSTGALGMPENFLLFIAHSGSRITIDINDPQVVAKVGQYYNTVDSPYPIYRTTINESTQAPWSQGWSSLTSYGTDSIGYRGGIEARIASGYGPRELFDRYYLNYGRLGTLTDFLNSMSLLDVWRHSTYSSGSDIDRCYYQTTERDGISYIKCVLCRNDSTQNINILPLMSGFQVAHTDTVDIYNIECVDVNTNITSIPYSFLNNETYFNPEEDAADPLPGDDEPDYNTDNSHTGGGKGQYNNYPGDDIGLPNLPSVGAIDTGFLTMYNPTSGQLQDLVDYLWTSDWIDNVKKMISNPMDAIISLQLAPYDIGSPVTSTCKIGAINTGITMSKVSNQYKILNCGTVSVPEHWGNALDYNNVSISIYLPYVGIRALDTNLIMNSTVGLAYYVDMLTGSAIAMLIVRKNNTNQSVYYTYDCNLNYQIPITGANYAETIKALFSVGASAVGAGMSLKSGNAAGALGATASMIGSAYMAGSGAHHYESSGNLSANTGILGGYTPYIIIELPKQSLPKNFNHLKGFTSNIYSKIGDLSGYTVVESVHVDNIPGATDREKQMIESLLMEGVIV